MIGICVDIFVFLLGVSLIIANLWLFLSHYCHSCFRIYDIKNTHYESMFIASTWNRFFRCFQWNSHSLNIFLRDDFSRVCRPIQFCMHGWSTRKRWMMMTMIFTMMNLMTVVSSIHYSCVHTTVHRLHKWLNKKCKNMIRIESQDSHKIPTIWTSFRDPLIPTYDDNTTTRSGWNSI